MGSRMNWGGASELELAIRANEPGAWKLSLGPKERSDWESGSTASRLLFPASELASLIAAVLAARSACLRCSSPVPLRALLRGPRNSQSSVQRTHERAWRRRGKKRESAPAPPRLSMRRCTAPAGSRGASSLSASPVAAVFSSTRAAIFSRRESVATAGTGNRHDCERHPRSSRLLRLRVRCASGRNRVRCTNGREYARGGRARMVPLVGRSIGW
jgi:hypothetical protein